MRLSAPFFSYSVTRWPASPFPLVQQGEGEPVVLPPISPSAISSVHGSLNPYVASSRLPSMAAKLLPDRASLRRKSSSKAASIVSSAASFRDRRDGYANLDGADEPLMVSEEDEGRDSDERGRAVTEHSKDRRPAPPRIARTAPVVAKAAGKGKPASEDGGGARGKVRKTGGIFGWARPGKKDAKGEAAGLEPVDETEEAQRKERGKPSSPSLSKKDTGIDDDSARQAARQKRWTVPGFALKSPLPSSQDIDRDPAKEDDNDKVSKKVLEKKATIRSGMYLLLKKNKKQTRFAPGTKGDEGATDNSNASVGPETPSRKQKPPQMTKADKKAKKEASFLWAMFAAEATEKGGADASSPPNAPGKSEGSSGPQGGTPEQDSKDPKKREQERVSQRKANVKTAKRLQKLKCEQTYTSGWFPLLTSYDTHARIATASLESPKEAPKIINELKKLQVSPGLATTSTATATSDPVIVHQIQVHPPATTKDKAAARSVKAICLECTDKEAIEIYEKAQLGGSHGHDRATPGRQERQPAVQDDKLTSTTSTSNALSPPHTREPSFGSPFGDDKAESLGLIGTLEQDASTKRAASQAASQGPKSEGSGASATVAAAGDPSALRSSNGTVTGTDLLTARYQAGYQAAEVMSNTTAGSLPTPGNILGQVLSSAGFFNSLAGMTGRIIEYSGAHDSVAVEPPIDRVSVLVYWWGYELVLPPPSLAYLASANSVAG